MIRRISQRYRHHAQQQKQRHRQLERRKLGATTQESVDPQADDHQPQGQVKSGKRDSQRRCFNDLATDVECGGCDDGGNDNPRIQRQQTEQDPAAHTGANYLQQLDGKQKNTRDQSGLQTQESDEPFPVQPDGSEAEVRCGHGPSWELTLEAKRAA